MATNLTDLSQIATSATALSNLLLVTPQATKGYQPQNADNNLNVPFTEPSFLFHYEGEQSIVLSSDITDHFVEDNTAIADQIALRPEEITTQGFIGELNNIAPVASSYVNMALQKLTILGAYAPNISETALLAYNEAFQAYQIGANALTAISSWGSINGNNETVINGSSKVNAASNQNKQQKAFQYFYGYRQAKRLFTVQTPWAVFQNMAILRLRAIQEGDTNVISNFEITFKMMRFASSKLTGSATGDLFENPARSSSSPLINIGTSSGSLSSSPVSSLYS